MNRTWTVCRQYSPRQDGERRWDQAYRCWRVWPGRAACPA